MVLKRTKNEVRTALASNIMETCRQVLPDIEEIFVEGLLGITLNKREIFLVNLSDIYQKESETAPPAKRRRGRRSGASEYKRDHSRESFDTEDSPSKRTSDSLPIAFLGEPQQDHDVSTHYIKEEEMTSPDEYSQPKVGRPPKHTNITQNFPELEDGIMHQSPALRHSPEKVRTYPEDSELSQLLSSEPILDLSLDKRNDTNNTDPIAIGQPSRNIFTDVIAISQPSTSACADATTSRRKRGRPRKFLDYIGADANKRVQQQENQGVSLDLSTSSRTSHNDNSYLSNQPDVMTVTSQNLATVNNEPQDFSQTSLKKDISQNAVDQNMNSDISLNNLETSFPSEQPDDYSVANGHQSSVSPQNFFNQSESNSNSQSEIFVQVKTKSNLSEEGMHSPGQSENSFQSGPVFPHLEEYDGVPFGSSVDDSSFLNDSSIDPTGTNDSFQDYEEDDDDDDDRIELTSTGRPKRKTSMSPWVRQFFNISTGGGESKTVQIKATQTCPICHKVFSAGSHLKRHYLVTHTDSSKFQCKVCSKRFGSSDHLKRHMGIHATEKKYKCHVCSRKFNVKYRLTEHLSERHGVKDLKALQIAIEKSENEAESVAMAADHDDTMETTESREGSVSPENVTIPT